MSPVIEMRVYGVFINSIRNTKSSEEVIHFLNDLLTSVEKIMLAKRVAIAFLLLENKFTYEQICKTLKVSKGTVAKVHAVLDLQGAGYRKILGDIIKKKVLKNFVAEILEGLTPLPSKGANWGEWKKERLKAKWEREKPL